MCVCIRARRVTRAARKLGDISRDNLGNRRLPARDRDEDAGISFASRRIKSHLVIGSSWMMRRPKIYSRARASACNFAHAMQRPRCSSVAGASPGRRDRGVIPFLRPIWPGLGHVLDRGSLQRPRLTYTYCRCMHLIPHNVALVARPAIYSTLIRTRGRFLR